ncbi:cobyrinic acid a,c-diamide synthase [Planctomycetes bacterium Poly30]|uniref:Cobyrinic acid a,c-diamide synthase n=1 Tax=Saltatorellus ferox TaxID=2528018 RepID=A0A518EZ24_9BACT|nr:cobyrinic acid a,c-diamide synthase [Planctomycetes bacterium Poly30]
MSALSRPQPPCQVPRLCLLALREDDDPIPFALSVIASARAEGLEVSVCTIGADRNLPDAGPQARLAAASGHAVHRIDVNLMPAPSIQGVVTRAGANVDFVIVLAFEAAHAPSIQLPAFVDVQHALGSPVVLCANATGSTALASRTQLALEFFRARGIETVPMVLLAGHDSANRAAGIEAATGLAVLQLAERTSLATGTSEGRLKGIDLDRLVEHSRSAPAESTRLLERHPAAHRGRRARIGVVMDDCFDLYDEESLLQFELAGAELCPLPAMSGASAGSFAGSPVGAAERLALIDELDGLIVGDGRVEKFSAALSAERVFRERLRKRIQSGLPTLASGGGFAYLTRGLRTLSGTLHPMLGVIDAEAVELQSRPSFGHVEVETLVDTLIGAPGLRLRGFVQRSWLVRGVAPEMRGIYATVSGPRDEGCGRYDLLATHFRPYWPSCPGAAETFIDRCVRSSVVAERALREQAVDLQSADAPAPASDQPDDAGH